MNYRKTKERRLFKKHNSGATDGTVSWEQWTKQRKEEYEKNKEMAQVKQDILPDRSVTVDTLIVGTGHLKRKIFDLTEKSGHKKAKLNHKKSEEIQESGSKQLGADEIHEKIPSKALNLSLSQAKNSSMRKISRSVLETIKKRDLKLFLASQGTSLKEWKQKRKEEYRLWKEAREAKKLKQLQKSKINEKCEEDNKEDSGKGRNYTVSIALPGSILDNAQSPELKTYLAGQIARAAAVFSVNEIVVFEETESESASKLLEDGDAPFRLRAKHGSIQMVKILQFLECPQYLRRYFFPLQNDLMFAGVLNPLDMPHHLRVNDVSPYREGVTLDKPTRGGKGSYVYIGFQKSAVIDKAIEPNVRVTVKLDEKSLSKKHYTGTVVMPSAPYKQGGIYWGYSVRLAESLGAVFSKCPFKEGYDLTIGTSDKGDNVDDCTLPSFKHALIVFGGLKGLEASLEGDERLTVDDPRFLFHRYLNTCPSQGARTIRTEEAILITLSALRPKILQCQSTA